MHSDAFQRMWSDDFQGKHVHHWNNSYKTIRYNVNCRHLVAFCITSDIRFLNIPVYLQTLKDITYTCSLICISICITIYTVSVLCLGCCYGGTWFRHSIVLCYSLIAIYSTFLKQDCWRFILYYHILTAWTV